MEQADEESYGVLDKLYTTLGSRDVYIKLVTVARIKGMCLDICFQPLGDVIHCRVAPL